MATVSVILDAAAQHLRVKPVSQGASGADALILLNEYNGLMHELSRGFDLLDTAGLAYTHADQAIGATFPLGDAFAYGLAAMVAERAAPQIGTGEVHKHTASASGRGYGLISGAFAKSVTQDSGLARRAGAYY